MQESEFVKGVAVPKNRAPKAQRREMNDMPPKKRDAKRVLHPLTEEEKRKRA
jgi:hypothetical protein